MNVTIGQSAPDFSLPDESGNFHALVDYRGKLVILYFYPKDNTPGCSKEALNFAQIHATITAYGGTIIGISRDSQLSHGKFKIKFSLPFTLLSDIDGAVCNQYEVIKEKNLYGKKTMGIERSTFIIDQDGVIRDIYRKVKVDGHAEQILESIKRIASSQ
ncbi:MAG: thioredoxin-dependent thiol peroxidase [Firmicutes bacterium]|nr:thioredoxin-dependent thiol peroxidase [Bacillota bacterium]